MKKILFGIIALLLFSTAYSQKINYQKSFDQALAKARVEHKLVFLYIFTPLPPVEARPANASFKSGIDAPEVTELFNKNFISYTVGMTDTAAMTLKRKYQLTSFPAYLFIDAEGNVVYKENYNSSQASKYLNMSAKALAAAASGNTMTDFDAKYKQGNVTAAFLKDYINKREDMGIFDNAKLVDEYVDFLAIKSFQNYQEVLFILKTGPYLDSKTYSLCYSNRKITDSIYKYEPPAVRSAINSRIMTNTMKKAISNKNQALAQSVSSFATRVYGKDYRVALKASQQKMLEYYRGVKDTAAYYPWAGYFIDANYMTISADSAKKLDAKRLESIKAKILANRPHDTTYTETKTANGVKRTIHLTTTVGEPRTYNDNGTLSTSVSSSTATVLNNAAYEFYTFGTHNSNYLTKALLWSRRAIELSPTAAFYDTQAHLLYRLGFFEEAKSSQTKAIELSQNDTKQQIEAYKTELSKIKSRTL